jgi:hypothetical protein
VKKNDTQKFNGIDKVKYFLSFFANNTKQAISIFFANKTIFYQIKKELN